MGKPESEESELAEKPEPFYECIQYRRLHPERFFGWLLNKFYFKSIVIFGIVVIIIPPLICFFYKYFYPHFIKQGFCWNLFQKYDFTQYSFSILITFVVLVLAVFIISKIIFREYTRNWLNLNIELRKSPLASNIPKVSVYYYTPTNIPVKTLEAIYLREEPTPTAKSLYKSIGAILAIFDYCYRYPVLATLRFWIEIPLIVLCIIFKLKIAAVFILIFFFIKAWLFIRLVYKLWYQFRIIEENSDIIDFETHPYVRESIESGDPERLRNVILNVWRIIFPFLPHFGGG